MEKITGFSMKDSISAPELRWNFFSCLRTEEDETFYTYNNKYMRHFVRHSFKGERVFNHFYKSKFCGDILKIISRHIKVEGNVYDIIEAFMNYKNDPLENIKKESDSKFDD